jgi:demethylmenaquinone methyltransferase/2-methoxy-6-polyprenyl-1,4-benzoquinol methylase
VAPHPVLSAYYREPSDRAAFVRELFDRTAPHYDHINRVFSFGSGSWYRRRALEAAGLRAGDRVLDVAVGTGLVAREALRITGSGGFVAGLDLSAAMLREAQHSLPISLVQGRAEQLPLAADSLNFLAMGYGLRHVAELGTVFREYRRVLCPGGTVLLLEIGAPSTPGRRFVARLLLGRVVPFLCRWTTRAAETRLLMRYYWDTIENCVPAATIIEALRDAGFEDVACRTEFDLFRAYCGHKPRAPSS